MTADPDPPPPSPPPPFGLPIMSVRTRGIVGMVIGASLIAIIVPIAWFTVPLMFGWGDPGSGASWSGTRTQSIVVLIIYALVAATGASAMLAGYAFYATGKARGTYVRPFLFFVTVLLVGAGLARVLLSRG